MTEADIALQFHELRLMFTEVIGQKHLTRSELAERMNVSERTITARAKNPDFPKAKNGRYPLSEVIKYERR